MALRKAEKVAVLSGLPLFEHCTGRDLSHLAAVTVHESFGAGAVLTREGQRGGLAYVMLSGSATARRGGRKVGTLGPGTVVGELSLIDGGDRTATLTADGPVEALAIAEGDFRKVVLGSPQLTIALLRTLAGRIRDADGHADLRD